MIRTLLAFLAAPMPGAFVQAVVVGLWPKPGTGVFEHPASMFAAMCLFVYLLFILFGVPAWLVLRRLRIDSLRAYALAGLAVVAGPMALVLAWMAAQGRVSAYIFAYDLALFAMTGLLAGAIFRRLAGPRPSEGD